MEVMDDFSYFPIALSELKLTIKVEFNYLNYKTFAHSISYLIIVGIPRARISISQMY
jgi:hypothetical protein